MRPPFRWSILVLTALLVGAAGLARAWGAPPEPVFVQISEDQGLSYGNVRAIAQDQQGFIWMGTTQGGLNRFDGYEIKSFRHDADAAASIASNFVWSLLVGRDGTLWVGTDSGLDRFDRRTETFEHFAARPGDSGALPSSFVLALMEDRAGTLWLGMRGGLVRMDRATGTFTTFVREPSVLGSGNANSIRCITEDPATGLLWLGSSDGLAAFDPRTGAFVSFVHDEADADSLCRNPVNRVLIDEAGVFWVFTDGGLDSFKPGFDRVPGPGWLPPRPVFRHIRHLESDVGSLAGAYLRGGTIDREGRLWVASNKGLNLVDRTTGRVTRYRNVPGDPTSLADDFTYSVFEDHSGNLWVATINAGVSRMRSSGKPFRVMRQRPGDPDSLNDNRVRSLCLDPAGRLWVGTLGGLSCYENGHWTHPGAEGSGAGGLPSRDIDAVVADSSGLIWIGTRDLGLFSFDGREFTSYRSPRGSGPESARELPYTGHEVNNLAFDWKGRLWIGARAYGLDTFDGTKFVHYAPNPAGEPARLQPTVFAALGLLDAAGRYWFGTESSGLVCMDPERDEFRTFLPDPKQPGAFENRGMYFVSDDGGGGLWIGGAAGLFRFDRARGVFTRRYTQRDGLPSDAVMSMQADLRGRLWLGTGGGIACLDPETGRVRSYDKADGLPTNGFAIRAAVRDGAGRLYFGSKAGVVSFDPDELRDNPTPPPVVLTDFRVLDRRAVAGAAGSPLREAISVAQEVRLGPDQPIFSIGFAALDFTAPQKNSYLFKMEGFDPDWRTADPAERRASYTNLPPGEYVFRVKAANSDRVWNEQGASIRVIVTPPWWRTWWFRALAVAVGGAALWAGIRWRERSIRHRNAALAQQIDARTAQLQAEVAVRERAEGALRESHAELENRVQERTAELGRANASLTAEIAERQKIEAQLLQAQKMEAFGQLAGGVAHDFNNLLTVILGQCEALRDPSVPEPEQRAALHDVETAARSASNLTRQLLFFSRRQAMSPVPLDLNGVVAGVIKLLSRIIGEKIRLECAASVEALPVMADPAMVEQVLVNLAVNARDAMPGGGQLTLATRRCTVSAAQAAATPGASAGTFACCTVTDTGQGIAPEVLKRIFEPFFTTKETGRGTGLGLATSLGIVQNHGGWIEVKTQPGRGTSFRFYLPCTGARLEPSSVGAPQEAFRPGTETILLVEDQDPVRKVALRLLQRQGYQVIEATNAQEALQHWEQRRAEIAVLITDVVMPGELNGRELAARLHAEDPRLRIVVMTGFDPAALDGMDASNRAWYTPMRKPFTRDQLLAAVERRLGG